MTHHTPWPESTGLYSGQSVTCDCIALQKEADGIWVDTKKDSMLLSTALAKTHGIITLSVAACEVINELHAKSSTKCNG